MTDRILLVDDDRDQCELLQAALEDLGHDATFTTSPLEALERVGRETYAAILTDLGMSDLNGLELCARIIGARPDVPVVVVTGNGSMEMAILAMRAGAYDFLTKPIDLKLLGISVARAVQHHRLQAEVKQLREESLERSALDPLIGNSVPMSRVRDLVARVGSSDVSVLVRGETGTGKEVVARALHAAGPRRNGPFVAINCSAIPGNLLESELFGHVKGAFTGASTARDGLFSKANGGTLLLDEIGDMPLEVRSTSASSRRPIKTSKAKSSESASERISTIA
jgi:two-component system response regulator HydG